MRKILSLVLVFLLMASAVVGCGAAKRDMKSTASSPAQEAVKGNASYDMASAANAKEAAGQNGSAQQKSEAPKTPAESDKSAVIGTGTSSQTLSNAILSQRKIIRNANVTVEVDDFDVAYGKIKSMIGAFGFVQESNIKTEKAYVDSKEKLIKKGVIIVRVDKDKFESVLSDVKGLGLLLNESIKSDDVTDKFFDTEAHLRLLKFEQNRLEQYLLKASDPDTIFKTESRLTQIRQEIEGLTGTLKKWTDLVELSTITININEKRPDALQGKTGEKTYWNRLSSSFSGSFKGVIDFCGDLLIFLVQAIPVLLLLALVVMAAMWTYRKFFKSSLKSRKDKDNDTQA